MSEPLSSAAGAAAPVRRAPDRRGWTRHGLNSGFIFNATCRGVALLPRGVSYAIGHTGTWLAWRFMPKTRAAVAENLGVLFPNATSAELNRLALRTLRAYAADVIDFLGALKAGDEEARGLFATRPQDAQLFTDLLAQGRGIILVSGHYGNWEIGSVFMRRVAPVPLTILAMPEVSDEVTRTRQEIRDSLGVKTIEVRKSLDTALQIRRRLGENEVVAILMDRHVGRDRVEVSFLGRRAWFLRTPALMAYLTGAPLVPCFIERIGPARYSVQPGEPIVLSHDQPREPQISAAAQQFAAQLEARIRRSPHHWYQFYSYWREQDDA